MLKKDIIKIRDNTNDEFTKQIANKLLIESEHTDNEKECRMFIYRHRDLLSE